MKVLVIHNEGPSGLTSGEYLAALDEVRELRDQGAEVRFHVVSGDNLYTASLLRKALAGVNLFWSIPSVRSMGRLLDEFRPDVAHFHSILPALTPSAFYACKRRSIPVVQTLHNFRWVCIEGGLFRDDFYCDLCIHRSSAHGLYHRCARKSLPLSAALTVFNIAYVRTRLLFRLVDAFVGVSKFVRDIYVRKGFPEDKVFVRYNGVTPPPVVKARQDRHGLAFVGRLTRGKGTQHLKHIMRAMHDVPFVIVGDGPELPGLKDFAAQNRLTQVEFKGRIDQNGVYEVLAGASCLLVPSVCGETFGRVVLEAMSVGTPVVASKIGGMAELLRDNAGAVAVDAASPQEFVDAAREIVESPGKARLMGEMGRRFAARRAARTDSASELMAIYEKVIHRAKAKR